jgi:hypothetical protein
MELMEYRNDFLEQVRARAAAQENYSRAAFVDYCAEVLGDADELADFESAYHRGTGARNRILEVDGFAPDDVDGSLRLVIANFEGASTPTTLTQTQAKTLFSRLQAFCEESLAGTLHKQIEESSPGYALASSLFQQRTALTRLRMYLVTDGILSTRIRDWPEQAIQGIPTEFHIWDVARFQQVQESATGRDELEVDFTTIVPGGLPCLPASVESDEYKAYLCVIPGKTLAAIYDEYGSRLLEGNVRSFLGTRGRINKAIKKTVNLEPRMFFAYNNGIASTATAAEVVNSQGSLRLTKVTDLQIVNGGQTTATLANALASDAANLEQTFVQMKLSVIPASTAGKVIPLIARYANSQNRVSDADFFSNHEFHRRMEQIAGRLRAPAVGGAQYGTHWVYERARGQYLNEANRLSGSRRDQFLLQCPRNQVITKTDLAKYENAWRWLPHTVSYGAQKNFLAFSNYMMAEWDKNPDDFNEEYYRRAVAKAIIFRRTEKLVSEQPWYQGGYRAQTVAYAVAKLSNLIQFHGVGKLVDFRSIWNRQALSPAMERQILVVAKGVFDVIVDPEGGFQNITEWCKKELCWQRARDMKMPFVAELASELADVERERETKQTAAATQRIVSGIELQSQVVTLGGPYWAELQRWGRAQSLLGPTEDSLLGVAAGMPRRLPSEKQSVRIMEIKAKLEEEGFRPSEA